MDPPIIAFKDVCRGATCGQGSQAYIIDGYSVAGQCQFSPIKGVSGSGFSQYDKAPRVLMFRLQTVCYRVVLLLQTAQVKGIHVLEPILAHLLAGLYRPRGGAPVRSVSFVLVHNHISCLWAGVVDHVQQWHHAHLHMRMHCHLPLRALL